MKYLVRTNIIPALLAFLVFFTTLPFIESIIRITSRAQAAIEWHGVEVLTKVVRPGGNLELVYSATINKQCPSDLRAFIVAPDGTVPIRFPTVAGGYARPAGAPVEIRVRLPIPEQSDPGLAPLVSGEHIYRTTVTRYCPDGVENDNSVPDAKFMMEASR